MKINDGHYKSTFCPKAMKYFKLRLHFPQINNHKQDIWSLGICVLCLLTNFPDYSNFYNFESNEIKFVEI